MGEEEFRKVTFHMNSQLMKIKKPANFKEIFYPLSRFGGFTDINGTIIFYTRINSLMKPDFIVVDFGCGKGAYAENCVDVRRQLRVLKGKVAKVIGIDIDP